MILQRTVRNDKKYLFLPAVVVTEIIHRTSLLPQPAARDILHLHLMHLSVMGKEAELICVHTRKNGAVLFFHCLLISLVNVFLENLAISKAVHDKNDFPLLDGFLYDHRSLCIFQCGFSLKTVLFFNLLQIFFDDLFHGFRIIQNLLIFPDSLENLRILLLKRQNLETNEPVQTHFQNRCGLALRKGQPGRGFLRLLRLKADLPGISRHQTSLGLGEALAAPENLDDQINDVAGLNQSFFDLLLHQFFFQQGLIFSGNHLIVEICMQTDDVFQSQKLRPPVGDGQHIDAEGILETRLFI